ncbi:hypothetical protein VTK73DRAFT_534 [Phialemonium thermophilum]|uniref:RRM domain-containing protein n=1 Tax=Phialemonium thermophilum TaxID=223376 RepID=A0ABR3Y567_9PEZI
MDLDIEMDDALDITPVGEETVYTTDIIPEEEQEPGEVDESHISESQDNRVEEETTLVPNKVHIRGLDTFNPEDVKAYVSEHFSSGRFERIEWIDDTSANLVFGSESTAQDAFIALAAVEVADPTQLPPLETLPAKSFSGKPESVLVVRLAVASDRKVTGAAARSRFYLLHPEYDPEERRRRGELHRSKYRDRNGYGRDRHRRDRPRRRGDGDDEEGAEPFDASLYDDDEAALAKRERTTMRGGLRRPRSRGSSSLPADEDGEVDDDDDEIRSRRNRDKELFPDRRPKGRDRPSDHRDRSASPLRDGSRMELEDLARDEAAAAQNREKARAIRDRLSIDNSTKELFPTKLASSSSPGHKAKMDSVDQGTVLSSAKLADRITPKASLADRITPRSAEDAASGLNIRGLANKRGPNQGIAIKGMSAKELFPEKLGNAGKELFVDKAERRRRQKAEDSFY